MEDLAFVALIIFVPQLGKERRLDGPFSRARFARRVLFTFFLSFFLSLSLSLSFSLSLSLVVARFLTDLTLSLSLSSRGLPLIFLYLSSPNSRIKQKKKHQNPKAYALGSPRATDGQATIGIGDGERENCRGHRLGWGRRFPFVPVDEDSIEASRAYWWVVSTHRCADVQLHQLRDQQSVHFDAI